MDNKFQLAVLMYLKIKNKHPNKSKCEFWFSSYDLLNRYTNNSDLVK